MHEIKTGIYKHFKGERYEVIGLATHSESEEKLVVYRPMYGDRALWVRPLEMFLGSTERDGKMLRRFEYVGNDI